MRIVIRVGLGLVLLGAAGFAPRTAMAQSDAAAQSMMERNGAPSNLGDPIGTLPLPPSGNSGYGLTDAGSNLFWHTEWGPNSRMELININGSVIISFLISANTGSANDITSDGTFLYIIDFTSQEVDIYDMNGVYQSSFAMPFTLSGITYNPNTGNLYIADTSNSIVEERTTAGVLVNSFPLPAGVVPAGL